MPKFIKGIELGESFFNECALPIIQHDYPNLKITAGLLGYGSDVLGFDDNVSTDHMWGPRFYLFLNEEDIHLKNKLMRLFETKLPYEYRGYSVNFSKPNLSDHGIRHAEPINSGYVSPLIWIYTVDEFVCEYLGKMPSNNLDWLAVSEHRLLGFTSGKIFMDMLNLSEKRKQLSFYPYDVKLYLIASQWALIAEEQAFVKRCSDCNDEIGSRIVCARIAERLMRLCFLYENKYAPYSKWFGNAFKQLQIGNEIGKELLLAISGGSIDEREQHIVKAQVLVAKMHNDSHISDEIEVNIQKYYGRNIDVIYADKIAEKVKNKLSDPVLKACPFIGSMSQIGNFVELSDNPLFNRNIQQLYKPSEEDSSFGMS